MEKYNSLTYDQCSVPAINTYPMKEKRTMYLLLKLNFSLFAFIICIFEPFAKYCFFPIDHLYCEIVLLVAPLLCKYIRLWILLHYIFLLPQNEEVTKASFNCTSLKSIKFMVEKNVTNLSYSIIFYFNCLWCLSFLCSTNIVI